MTLRERWVIVAAGVTAAVGVVLAADRLVVKIDNLEGGIEAFYHDAIGRLDDLAEAATPEGGEDSGR